VDVVYRGAQSSPFDSGINVQYQRSVFRLGSQDAAVDIAGYINSPAASVTARPGRGAAGLSATYEASRYGSVDDVVDDVVVDVVVDAAKSPRPSADDRETCRGPAGPLVCPAPRPLPGSQSHLA
jgi:hypothetical protein